MAIVGGDARLGKVCVDLPTTAVANATAAHAATTRAAHTAIALALALVVVAHAAAPTTIPPGSIGYTESRLSIDLWQCGSW